MSALFSPCRTHRYRLTRELAGNGGTLFFIGLNPSTADETHNDPTIRRCMDFAERWGHSRLVVGNLFSYRATHPKDLRKARDPNGPESNPILLKEARNASQILIGWGVHGTHRDRNQEVLDLLDSFPLFCLGRTKNGHPRHPLYIRASTLPESYSSK